MLPSALLEWADRGMKDGIARTLSASGLCPQGQTLGVCSIKVPSC